MKFVTPPRADRAAKVDADGHCLLHSVSVCLMGTEIYYNALRQAVGHELKEYRDFYVGALGEAYEAQQYEQDIEDAVTSSGRSNDR
jgi:hypothetical protein